jgi:hypothetical protein
MFAMEYMPARETAKKLGITPRRVQALCAEGRIVGAWRLGEAWAIPTDARKPRDERELISLRRGMAPLVK